MKSYLSLIPISAKVHRRQNRMTRLCIVFAVFMVTAIFSMAEMGTRMEQARLAEKHGAFSLWELFGSTMGQTLLLAAAVLFLLVLVAGVLMISGSLHSSVVQRTQFFGMMRCIGMSRQQIARFVRLEALNWCKSAIPAGLVLGIAVSWGLCAILRFWVGEEFSSIPLFGISGIGIVSGILVALLESKIRYAVTLFAASGGLTLLLSQYLFPAVEQAYLGAVYQVGLYALLAVQIALLLVSCAGICLKEEPKGQGPSIDFKRDTLELPIADIDQALLDGETVDQ